ncbi:MAG: phosphoribosylanthranilate isomerase [Cytophagales bacterium]|nr:phosphoribosylanthranilate isomerase [Cytophagales bacterium]
MMKLKVCGMKYPENMQAIIRLSPDFLGLIFYPKSPRYMAETMKPEDVQNIPPAIKKVGVFVNESVSEISKRVNEYSLDLVQLHGDESPDFCKQVKATGVDVIKVFHIDANVDWEQLRIYQPFTDYFLFDTKSKNYGGTGKSFNWEILNGYDLEKPYFLGGGVSLENIDMVKKIGKNGPLVLDVNSRFETKPGYKDITLLAKLTEKLGLDFQETKN